MTTKFKDAAEALFQGDANEAAKLLVEGAKEIAHGEATRASAASLKSDELVHAVTKNVTSAMETKSALDKVLGAYPELRTDSDYIALGNSYVTAYLANGAPMAEAIAMAGDAVGEKFSLGKFASKSKKDAPHSQDQDETPERIIAEMAQSRPGSRGV